MDILTRMGILHLMIGETQTAFTRLLDALVIDGNSPKLILALGGILQVSVGVDEPQQQLPTAKEAVEDA